MTGPEEQGMLLGKHTPVVQEYAPQLLYPIPRAAARQQLWPGQPLPFHGVDLWHAYEMSWLDETGKPEVRVGRFTVPASSPNIVESKSFKLYLNSLNNMRFASPDEAAATICRDVGAVAGESVSLELLRVDDPSLAGKVLPGLCLDDLSVSASYAQPDPEQLEVDSERIVEETLYSHLLRSLCPVTGQPDWATLWIQYRGKAIGHTSLLQYIIAYRQHQGFHEQCVERVFSDIHGRCGPDLLHVQAFYTRRGGLDINPFRSTEPGATPLPRLDRQ